MGPIIGMSPDKKAETPGMQGERVGLRGLCGGAGTLPEAECGAASPLATSLDRGSIGSGGSEDEELTNLNWLHENLLQNFTLGGGGEAGAQHSASPLFDIEGNTGAPQNPSSSSLSQRDSLKSKPPFSFSLLIYMAIEQSPSKSLPVKDIYGWIVQHFPYFSSAPTGWKNSVRHNLSLNKCFRKVERSLGKLNGKGSLWCVDPEYRPNLIQALKKQHFPAAHAFCTPPASPLPASSPPATSPHRHLFVQGCSLKESDIDAATAMMLLNAAPGHHHANPCDPESPLDLSRPDLVLVSSDPNQDHNYSSMALQRCSSRSSSSSLDDGGPSPGHAHHRPRTCRAGSEGFHSDEDDSDLGDRDERGGRPRPAPRRSSSSSVKHPAGKRARRELTANPELDEELKEAAGSLLHLAGIRTSMDLNKRSAKSKKLNRK